jgi:hypothetical protein
VASVAQEGKAVAEHPADYFGDHNSQHKSQRYLQGPADDGILILFFSVRVRHSIYTLAFRGIVFKAVEIPPFLALFALCYNSYSGH